MNKRILILLFFPIIFFGQGKKDLKTNKLFDGPYIFIKENKLIEKTIKNGKVYSTIINSKSYDTVFDPEKSTFTKVKKIVALSDIHGQYDLAVELLKNNKIIDKKLNWNFGKGHLVIVGDIFDRGDKINEVLWLIYKLEIQAEKKGGKVHFLLGNHEFMVLQKDLRYINKKYKITTKLLGLEYNELYGNQTVLGRWLRSKSTIIKINDNIFVHGGVSEEFIKKHGSDLDKLNIMMRKNIDFPKTEMKSTDFYNLYYGQKGLVWYRGYFEKYFDMYKEYLKDEDITRILNFIGSEHIVVGHCSHDEIVQLYNNKIFGVDSSIKKGEYGEVLFIKKKRFFRGDLNGKLSEFINKKIDNKNKEFLLFFFISLMILYFIYFVKEHFSKDKLK